ncbi:MAG: transcription-repair coupling factor, partial [Pseudomonadota bacterium]|nr:transcription-repair coupling factor [Pseudomonadota bacterium]
LADARGFFAPEIETLSFPAWDGMPYDRISPNAEVSAQRVACLSRLARLKPAAAPVVLLATVNAIVQRVPPRTLMAAESFTAAPGNRVDMDGLVRWLEDKGFLRTSTVRETGEYAVRGGIVDLFAPGTDSPVRLDFFGDTLESIRSFDPESQRTTGQLRRLELMPMSEVLLSPEAITRFRLGYVAAFGAPGPNDALYQAVSEGRRYPGMEHWLPLFHEGMETLFDYVDGAPFAIEHLVEDAARERLEQVSDHYRARREQLGHEPAGVPPYRPLEPDRLYLAPEEWRERLGDRALLRLTPFAAPEAEGRVIDAGGRQSRNFAPERANESVNVFDALIKHVRALQADGRKVVIACWGEGSRERMGGVLADHGLATLHKVSGFAEVQGLDQRQVGLAVLGLENGFETAGLAVIGEQDILGERLVRPRRRRQRPVDVLREVASLSEGDLVVHMDHGIGRFVGLRTIEAAGAPHDCLEIIYSGNDKLFLPVANIDLLTRYGSEDTEVQLDRLGGVAWQTRKARLKQRIREMAERLIKVAAARALQQAAVLPAPDGVYDEFCARFPYEETEDQQVAIDAVLSDLQGGRPMDRLICGDVGFGKTEVALRAAFVTAMAGKQVAVVVPTTLLARQHYKTFCERFHGYPVKIRQVSRLVDVKELKAAKEGLASGDVDIVIGTHALLGKAVKFRDLGLLIVDEEQHFGVAHKERLKEMRAEVHVLTLTATPIPRTLQLALTGVRELSIIATPPIDRLAVRTYVLPLDPLNIRESLLRERYRGGQAFYVAPRISDLDEIRAFVAEHVPEVKIAVAHGQMPPSELEDVMGAFYDGKFDVLLSTTIIESGLDIPTANTLVVHRADMFGLAQLYQIRGRIGRSKTRAYALFTIPPDRKLTPTAEKRLKVLQSLDTLGAGFQLASHDLDIRGAGNLLGEEQSGHIREVGYELYQAMLEEAVASLRAGGTAEEAEQWSPQITIGVPVLIPEDYVPDLQLRLDLYRRLARIDDDREIDSFGAELADRFGPLPDEVQHLLRIVSIKALCLRAGVQEINAGPKGMVLAFRNNSFADPSGLVRYIADQGTTAKVRPDHRIVFLRDWPTPDDRLKGAGVILRQLAKLAKPAEAQPASLSPQLLRAAAGGASGAKAGERPASARSSPAASGPDMTRRSSKSGSGSIAARVPGRPASRR